MKRFIKWLLAFTGTMFLMVALLTFTFHVIGTKRKENMRAQFSQYYPSYAIREIFNIQSFPKPPEYMVVYRDHDKYYRAWLDGKGKIMEQERAGEP